jgi:hypothetical protein
MSGCEGGLACHPERSEGSGWLHAEILRCAQDDTSYLEISTAFPGESVFADLTCAILLVCNESSRAILGMRL